MTSKAPRILVTGFGPFPGVPDNPTSHLINWLAKSRAPNRRYMLETALLPVDWSGIARVLDELIERCELDAVLHFGASRRATAFNIEQWARNRCSAEADAHGRHAASREVIAGGPRTLRTRIPAARLLAPLRAKGLPAVASDDAGRYLCNMTLYLGLNREHGPLVQFVHVPAVLAAEGDGKTLSWAGLQQGALLLIDALAAAAKTTKTKLRERESNKGARA